MPSDNAEYVRCFGCFIKENLCHHHNCSGGAKLANQKRAARKLGRRSRGW